MNEFANENQALLKEVEDRIKQLEEDLKKSEAYGQEME